MNVKNEDQFQVVIQELEALAGSYAMPANTEGYEGVWLPPDNTVRMWTVPRTTAEYLQQLVEDKKPKTILELGTSSGFSTLFLAAGARQHGGHVYTIEMAQPKIDIAQNAINRAGFQDAITILKGDIASVLDSWDKKIDFVFMDADKHNYLPYIKQIEPHLAGGAVIVADNAIDFSDLMQDYIKYMQSQNVFKTKLLRKDNGLLVSEYIL